MFDELFQRLWVSPSQDRDEFFSFIEIAEKYNLNTIVEIGAEYGGTLRFWDYLLGKGGLLISIDITPQIRWDIKQSGNRIEVVVGNSQEEIIRDKVGNLLNGRGIDLLFIDGDHRYECVKKDYENYSPFVRKGGLIAFHDIMLKLAFEFSPDMQPNGTVARFWQELKVENKREIVSSRERNGFGIGYFLNL